MGANHQMWSSYDITVPRVEDYFLGSIKELKLHSNTYFIKDFMI